MDRTKSCALRTRYLGSSDSIQDSLLTETHNAWEGPLSTASGGNPTVETLGGNEYWRTAARSATLKRALARDPSESELINHGRDKEELFHLKVNSEAGSFISLIFLPCSQ